MSINILGISAYYHDSAACLLRDGEVIAAAQEERFTRKKHDDGFPKNAIAFCMKEAGLKTIDLTAVAYYDKPLVKFNRILETYMQFAPKGISSFIQSVPLWLGEKLWIPTHIQKQLDYDGEILFTEHHESHAASAFYLSPFNNAAILTVDGVGEWATVSIGRGDGRNIEIMGELNFPHSLGLLYSAFTYFTGFKVNSGEYKIMGLAPYGTPKYVDTIYSNLLDLREDGSFRLNMAFFDYCVGLKMTSKKFEELFDGPPRDPESDLTQREMDLAASVQVITEEIVLRMAKHLKKETNESKLCMAGGVALNCVANGKLLRSGLFDDIWIQPAAGDAGGALGAAYAAYYKHCNGEYIPKNGRDIQKGSHLGSYYSDEFIRKFLEKHAIPYHRCESMEDMCDRVSTLLVEGNVVGWFQGKMEFGPRALGARSIIGDARVPEMQKKMNLKIKYRESFRPFAPSVLAEHVGAWFKIDRESPYMLLVADVVENARREMTMEEQALWGIEKLNVARSTIPAVTHVDYSARLQTVNRHDNPIYHTMISKFYEKTGCPVIVNTSFNVRGEPIVESPGDAYKCFMRTEMDVLALGNFILFKTEQPEWNDTIDWRQVYELD